MKTKVNEVPLVGPRGRKELLKRINELEAQVAQQDYIYFDVPNGVHLTEIITQELATDLHNRGVLLDVIISSDYDETKWFSRILSYVVGADGSVVSFSYLYEDGVMYQEF